MNVQAVVPAGIYVVAVSGGVDSVVLLDALVRQNRSDPGVRPKGLQFIVAHFDHGIRPDSAADRLFVEQLAAGYGLPFEYAEGKLGPSASEAVARRARYEFLHAVRLEYAGRAVITAHHQDDAIETAIINMLRGTKSRGLSSMRSTGRILRPLLDMPKIQLVDYARQHQLMWHEDSTNQDERYMRNYVRRRLVPRLSPADRQYLLICIDRAARLNAAIACEVGDYLAAELEPLALRREPYRRLPDEVGREILAAWLRLHTSAEVTGKLLARLDTAIRSARTGARIDIMHGDTLHIERHRAVLRPARTATT